jgi:hypothetical protein
MWLNWILATLILGSFATIVLAGLTYVGSGVAGRYRERVKLLGWRRPTLGALLALLLVASALLGFWLHLLALLLVFALLAAPVWLHKRRSPAHVLLREKIERAHSNERPSPDELRWPRLELVRRWSMRSFSAGCLVFGLILVVILATRI